MIKQLVLKQVIILFYLLFGISSAFAAESFPAKVYHAKQNQRPMPHLSLQNNTIQISEAEAYQLQKSLVELHKNDSIAGYKAGLTSQQSQQKFNLDHALSGVLLASGNISDPTKIQLKQASQLMIETEIGFILNQPIVQPVKNIAELKTAIEAVAAVIELPDLGYEHASKISALDLIAANLASHQYLMLDPVDINQIKEINSISTHLYYQDKLLFKGQAQDALGDQWQALLWLVNHLLQSGYQLSTGDLLITGALGKMVKAQSGSYHATFDQLGEIKFTIQ
ncbi:2-keto-4-pentenoate hydratase [Aliikangiella sp. IMCC44653]